MRQVQQRECEQQVSYVFIEYCELGYVDCVDLGSERIMSQCLRGVVVEVV